MFLANPLLDELFSFHEFNAALADKKDSSAPGIDGIGFDAIKKLPLKYKLLLLDIFNKMYSQAIFPDSWTEAFVIFISKASGSGLRPISLTSCFCKLFETLVRNRLQWWAETNNWLPRSQHGFRKGFSCSDNLTGLLLRAEEALSTGREVSTAFLDVEGAFDKVNIDILIDSLSRLGCSSCPLKFIKFITHERIIHTTNNDTTRRSYKGVPQGSVLSPLLYSIYVASIIEDLPAHVYISQFADDLAVYTISGDSVCSISSLENSVQIIDRNLNKLGLNIAPHKTKFIHINNKKIKPGSKAIRVRESTIKSGNNYKFLGIIFDYELSFKAQVNHIHTRCSSAMNMIRFLRGTWWGSHPETLTTMYKCYIRSILDYACYVNYPSISTLQLKLERIQYAAIRLCLGYRQSTPTNILLAESKLYHRCASALTSWGSRTSPKSLAIEALRPVTCYLTSTTLNLIIQTRPSLNASSPSLTPTSPYSPIKIATCQDAINSPNPNHVIDELINSNHLTPIYTDGSKITGAPSVGCAFLCPADDHHSPRSLSPLASIFSAECYAIRDALDYIIEGNDNRSYVILSDSLSVLSCLDSRRLNVKTNHVIFEILGKHFSLLQRNCSVRFAWIPSHIGIQGNEAVDALARAATCSDSADHPPVAFSDLAETFRRDCRAGSTSDCENDGRSKGKTYFELYHHRNSASPWYSNRGLTRAFIVTINRMRSNHHSLAESLHRKNIISDPGCACGFPEESLNHILWRCEDYNQPRSILIKDLAGLGIPAPFNIESLIAGPNIPACKAVFAFLTRCRITI
ncbi:hypothetical protein TKK_0019370 [Trichogramma kaykai]